MSTPNTLSTDLNLMHAVAAKTDACNEELRGVLQAFIGRVSSVPPSVWGGLAATRFKEVVERWNAESMKLYHALHGIAESIRYNEATLREAGENHAHRIATVGGNL
jgi:WXG100 family type VII secretion target